MSDSSAVSCGPFMGSFESGWVVFFESAGCVVRRLGAGDAGRSSGGCGQLGVGGAGRSSSSTSYRALVSGGQVSSSSRVVCSLCGSSMPVTRAGLLRVHGPLGNRCAGSGMSTFSILPRVPRVW